MSEEPSTSYDFIAELTYDTEKNNGMEIAATSKTWHHLKFPFHNNLIGFRPSFVDKEWVDYGDTVTAYIKLLYTENFTASLVKGDDFQFLILGKIKGNGRVIEILNPTLQK